jgi:hypothetical protein
MRDSSFCLNHDPNRAEANRRRASKGGRRGGRGRSSAELAQLQKRFEELADLVLAEQIDRSIGIAVGQLLNGARACIRDSLAAKEQEQLIERLELLEEQLQERRDHERLGA